MSEPILRVSNLCKSYRIGRETLEILQNVNLDVREGEILAIVGASGSGKSTLLHQIGLLDVPDSGEILFRGEQLPLGGARAAVARNQYFGFVFQFYHLLPEFNAFENVLMPAMILDGYGSWLVKKSKLRDRAHAILERMGLSDRVKHRPKELSGGERQRVAIARALMNSPDVLLCDEPTGNLDRKTAQGVKELLWDLNRTDRQTMIVVTHDSTLAAEADRTSELIDGRLKTIETA